MAFKKLEQRIVDDTYFGVRSSLADLVTDFEYVAEPKHPQGRPDYAEGAAFVSCGRDPEFPLKSFKPKGKSHFGFYLSAKLKPEVADKIAYRLYDGLGSIEFLLWKEHGMVSVMACDKCSIAHVRLGFVPLTEFENLEIKER